MHGKAAIKLLTPSPKTTKTKEKTRLILGPGDYWVHVSGLLVKNTSEDWVLEVVMPDHVMTRKAYEDFSLPKKITKKKS